MTRKLIGPVLAAVLWAGLLSGEQSAQDVNRAVAEVIHLAADGSDILRGNGFLISSDGLLVTNYHVVVGAARLRVQIANGDVYDHVIVEALDPDGDIAVLKLPAFQAPYLRKANWKPTSGESIRLVGRNVAYDGAVEAVHTLAPDLDIVIAKLRVDARSKGGPVVNAQGESLGIVTLTYEPGAGMTTVIPLTRVDALLSKRLSQPLEDIKWESWSAAANPAHAPALEKAGLRRRLPDPRIRGEKDLSRRLELALAFDPTDLAAKALLARAYIRQGLYEKAGAEIDQVLAADPNSSAVVVLKGDLLVHTGQFDEARKLYQSVVDKGLQPPNNYSKARKGVVSGQGFHDHAIQFCQGNVVLGADEFAYEGGWGDAFFVRFDTIKAVTVKPMLWSGRTVYQFKLQFRSPVANTSETWKKENFTLRIPELEVRDNLVRYLKQRGVALTEQAK